MNTTTVTTSATPYSRNSSSILILHEEDNSSRAGFTNFENIKPIKKVGVQEGIHFWWQTDRQTERMWKKEISVIIILFARIRTYRRIPCRNSRTKRNSDGKENILWQKKTSQTKISLGGSRTRNLQIRSLTRCHCATKPECSCSVDHHHFHNDSIQEKISRKFLNRAKIIFFVIRDVLDSN